MSLSPEAYILPILVVVFEWGSVIYSGMYFSILFEAMSNYRDGIGAFFVVLACVIFSSYLGLTILLTNAMRRGSVSALKGWVVTWGVLLLMLIAFIIYYMTLHTIGKYALVLTALLRLGAIIVIINHKNELASAGQTVPQVHVIGKNEFHHV